MNKQTVLRVLQNINPEAAKILRKTKCDNEYAADRTTCHEWLDCAIYFHKTQPSEQYWWSVYRQLKHYDETPKKMTPIMPKAIKLLLKRCSMFMFDKESIELINNVKAIYNV